ncbi:MAG: hypothetical protein RSB08_02010, partial [Clostridia bacterium]
ARLEKNEHATIAIKLKAATNLNIIPIKACLFKREIIHPTVAMEQHKTNNRFISTSRIKWV